PSEETSLEAVVSSLIEEPAAPPAKEAFGWTAFGEPEVPPEVEIPAVEEATPIEEAAEPRGPEEIEAPPVVEIPVVEEEPPLEVTALEILPEELVPTPAVEESLGVTEIEMEIPKPIEETAAMPEVPAAEVTTEPFTVEREYLKKHPRDYETWLALARALWQANEQEEALEIYTRVIRAGKFLEGIITTLERYVEQQPDVSTQRVLGDAYMKDDRLQEALDIYRQTLEDLENQEGTWNTR
ncbi:MAG: hypothetical protein SWK90_18935, partial [Chloroflexota bacterium]|nr:hypothetical protein [Chloroflexota bacterium]